jgi:hypothetical protein
MANGRHGEEGVWRSNLADFPEGIVFDSPIRPLAVSHLFYSPFATLSAGKIFPLTSPNPIR